MNKESYSRQLIKSYWPSVTPTAMQYIIDRMDRDGLVFGQTTSVMHEVHQWGVIHDDRPNCTICGTLVDKLCTDQRHPLCAARQRRGLPTPPVDDTRRCPCYMCSKGVA